MQVLYLGRAPCTKETLPDFLKVALGNPTSTCIPRVDGSQRTPELGRHINAFIRVCMVVVILVQRVVVSS